MQDIIIQQILKYSLVPKEIGCAVLSNLFEADYSLPDEVVNVRPSLLNFNLVLNWGGNVENAYIASLSAINSNHGCFSSAFDTIKAYFETGSLLMTNGIVSGFGSPVYKGFDSDQRCELIRYNLFTLFRDQQFHIERLVNFVRTQTGKDIWPNLTFWNAMCIYLLGLPREYASLVFILASQIRHLNEYKKPTIEAQ